MRTQGTHYLFTLIVKTRKNNYVQIAEKVTTSKFREFISPAKIFFKKSSENVKFIGGFIHTMYILPIYVDSTNA